MSKRISIGTWAYAIGPYADSPIPFEEIVEKLNSLGFDGLELGGFGVHPNPDLLKTKDQRAQIRNLWESKGMGCSGLAADLWSEKLITADTNASYLATFRKNLDFCQDMGIDVIRVDTTEDPGVLGQIGDEPKAEKIIPYDDAPPTLAFGWPGSSNQDLPSINPATSSACSTGSIMTTSPSCTTPATPIWSPATVPGSRAKPKHYPAGPGSWPKN
jgi:hypothetical protein